MARKNKIGNFIAAIILLIPLVVSIVFAVYLKSKNTTDPGKGTSTGTEENQGSSSASGPSTAFVPDLQEKDIEYGEQLIESQKDDTILVDKDGIVITLGQYKVARLAADVYLARLDEQISEAPEDEKEILLASRDRFDKSDADIFNGLVQSHIIYRECEKEHIVVDKEDAKRSWLQTVKALKENIADPNALGHEDAVKVWNRELGIMKGMGYSEEQYADYMATVGHQIMLKNAHFSYYIKNSDNSEKSKEEQEQIYEAYITGLVDSLHISNPYL